MSKFVDLTEVKRQVDIGMVLEHFGVLGELRQSGSKITGNCPLPTHSSNSKGTFTATMPNRFACHSKSCISARENICEGKAGGNQLDLTAVMLGDDHDPLSAGRYLAEKFGLEGGGRSGNGKATHTKPKRQLFVAEKASEPEGDDDSEVGTDDEEGENTPLEFSGLKSIDWNHEYLEERKIQKEVAAYFGAGYFFGKGMMAGRFVFPIHNSQGELVAYSGRAVDDDVEPRHKVPKGFKKSWEIYNLHRVLELDTKEAICVEGFFDTLTIHQAGYPNVVATMGARLYPRQEKLLVENFDRVILIRDNDDAGNKEFPKIAVRLAQRVDLRIVEVPSQPDELSSDEIRALLESVVNK